MGHKLRACEEAEEGGRHDSDLTQLASAMSKGGFRRGRSRIPLPRINRGGEKETWQVLFHMRSAPSPVRANYEPSHKLTKTKLCMCT